MIIKKDNKRGGLIAAILLCAIAVISIGTGFYFIQKKDVQSKSMAVEKKQPKKEYTVKEKGEAVSEDKQEMSVDEAQELYQAYLNSLADEYGYVTQNPFYRRLADDRTSEYSPIMDRWYELTLQNGEKGIINTYEKDFTDDGIPELIVFILTDSGEYYASDEGYNKPKNAWVEMRVYGIVNHEVVEIKQDKEQNIYSVFGCDYRGTWRCFYVESDEEEYIVVLSFFSNGRIEASYDCRASVFQIQNGSLQCLYNKKISNEEFIDLQEIPLDRQMMTDSWRPLSPDEKEKYAQYLSDELKAYCNLSDVILPLFDNLFSCQGYGTDLEWPDFMEEISRIAVESEGADSVKFSCNQ